MISKTQPARRTANGARRDRTLSAQLLKLGVRRLPIGADADIILLHDTSVAGDHMRDEGKQSGSMVCCEACGTAVPAYDVVNYGSIEQGYRELCNRCFNAEVASALGLERFENVRLHPVVMTDCAGERHEFHFRMRLLGSMAALDAFELTDRCAGGISVPDTRETGRRTIVAARPPDRADAPKSVRQASRAQRARHADCRPDGMRPNRMG